ncbi:MAG: hypothetical protein AAF465_04440 [Pseudomonadota bacterium]
MKTIIRVTATALLFTASIVSHAASVSLASFMSADSYMAETSFSGAFAQIGRGDGSLGSVGALTGDNDGLYNFADFGEPDPQAFGGVDLFPREQNFEVGSLTYDDSQLNGSGTETVQITGIDLSAFWTADPARLDNSPGAVPTVLSDISDQAIGLWLFNNPGGISFGGLDSNDTLTFVDGVLTSIDLSITTQFTVESFTTLVFDGTFTISGSALSYMINDSAAGSTFIADLNGEVLAVSQVPVPPALVLLPSALALLGLSGRRRRP